MSQVFTRFEDIPLLRYELIMADPPWKYRQWSDRGQYRNAASHYEVQDLTAITKLFVGSIASRDAILWLWATNPMLPQAFRVLEAWGFQFVTAGHWVKRTRHGKLGFGTGYALRSAGEPYLIGKVGAPRFANNVRSVIEGPLRDHSRKPDEAYFAAQALAVDAEHRIDLFSRETRPGWDCFGDEVGKFGEAVA